MGIMDYSSQCSETSIKREKNKKKRNTNTPSKIQIPHTRICRVFFFFFFFFKVIYHGYCITVFTIIPKKGKEQEKKEIPKPSQKDKFCIAGYVDFSILYIF